MLVIKYFILGLLAVLFGVVTLDLILSTIW